MKSNLFFILLFFSFINIQAQNEIKIQEEKKEVNSLAEFTGGNFRERLSNNLDVSSIDFQGKITTTVSFTVDEDGNLKNVKAIGNNEEFNAEVIRTVKSIRTKWIPARKDGKPIESTFSTNLTLNSQ